jgi:predicted nucleic acid-binding protein
MTLIDSSGWIEFFTEGPLARTYAHHLRELHDVVTPTVVLYEVYKVIKRQRGEEEALSHLEELRRLTTVTSADAGEAAPAAALTTPPQPGTIPT